MHREAEHLPHALSQFEQILEIIGDRKPLLVLDYDGTLSPIVSDPEKATMSEEMKEKLDQLSRIIQVAVISGRDRKDVEQKVGLGHLIYAGSHGLDMAGPQGLDIPEKVGGEILTSLQEAARNLERKLSHVKGCLVESKKFAIAVHFRNVAEEEISTVEKAVSEELENRDKLKKGTGKKILELKPNIDWHKGRALNWLFDALGFNKESGIPIFVGDDITDEDAFQSISGQGIGILVGTHGEKTAASYALEGTEEVRDFLNRFYETMSRKKHGEF
jgi:trehalose-phosphatase